MNSSTTSTSHVFRVLTGLLVTAVVLAAPATAYWRSMGSGIGSATTATLATPTGVTVAPISLPNVAVNWMASISPPTATGYYITRTSAGATVAACATSAASTITTTTCTDSSVPGGTYTYRVTAVYRSWTAVSSPSGSVVVSAGTAALLVFGQQPTNAAASHTITPAITAFIEDQFGNVTTSTATVTIAIAHNAGGLLPGTLYGTKTVQAIAGTATFSGLSIDGAVLGLGGTGNGYTLKVTSGALTPATSSPFNIT